MASFKPPSTYAKPAEPAPPELAARTIISARFAERYGAARQCALCRLVGEDRPGSMCAGPLGEIECGGHLPLYTQTLDAQIEERDDARTATKYVAP
ncbi:hypothetical protein [Porphyrobacter sp. YT40]|uniref:hypothetical protein n=1 Tax=Porphyrobacter sp. YT40 TaxID=2547601 RepID=UPI0011412108|nr:hypothetical protein [Porphyrobacter sp. YT40]QDH34072.1 hypothetical protein E2E27_06835 [Porphyrobacter sp. YT40]